MSNMQPPTNLRQSEQGMIAIMTTIVLMIVISLIVLGFAQIARRNQRETLDRQLSTQAFYAAETGINDTRKIIQEAVNNNLTVTDKTQCGGSGVSGFYAALNPDIDTDKNIKYTCLLVDASPKTLQYSNVGNPATVIPLISDSGANIRSVQLKWNTKEDTDTPTDGCPTSVNTFVPNTGGSWPCGFGVLRIDLVPTQGSLTADSLRDDTMTVFAVPFASGGATAINYAPSYGNSNNRIGVACDDIDGCSLRIDIPGGAAANSFHMRVSSIYRENTLSVQGQNAAGTALEIRGAQAVIDVTGKAQDVLRRIKVAIPLRTTSKNLHSDYAIEMNGSLCKRYSIMQGYISSDPGSIPGGTGLCQAFSSP
ncbi:MAG TPA: pilus assembly PilX N-terminal domain-containing protein [Candidatus Saccharimonadales bacterium]